ncbi:hypothetical protein [White spot syndrome virus]|uniref:Uncharacterized protein n=1 Tax=White spot syndrome virus TaxID=342409 RepID=A0A2R2XEY1_9VIRU|nr:hypothetical protein [White spot syndrome virus]WCQ76619.1 hypothetical protein WSSU-DNA_00029 [White spot syndrome virus]
MCCFIVSLKNKKKSNSVYIVFFKLEDINRMSKRYCAITCGDLVLATLEKWGTIKIMKQD